LAARQGVLYSHQLPAANGAGDPARHLIAHLLAGTPQDLEPVCPTPVEPDDAALDDVQREAVARALATPDLCLVQGLPGTGKSRVVTEILTQAAARGERMLFLAPGPEPVDRVLESLAGREAVCPLRLLGRDERIEELPPGVRGFTLAEQERRLREESIPTARREAEAAEERCRLRRGAAPLWEQLLDLAGRLEQLAGQVRSLDEAHARAGAEVEGEAAAPENAGPGATAPDAAPFAAGLRVALQARDGTLARLDADLAKLTTRLAELRREQETLAARLQELASLVEARRHRRWWVPAWWRAVFRGKVLQEAEDFQTRRQQADAEVRGLEEEGGRLRAEQDEARQRYAAERGRLTAAEIARRQADLSCRRAALEQEQVQLDAKWRAARGQLPANPLPPAAPTRRAVEEAREASALALRREEECAAFGHRWAACLEESAAGFGERLLAMANVVAGTTSGLAAAAGADLAGFDLLVLEGADQVTDAEFLTVAARARRWVLVGQSAEAACRPAAAQPARSAVPYPGFFERLWLHLHCDPRRLPYAWVEENGGLCCRLRPVTAAESQYLESERVADRPDIELRILTPPRREPVLAEVVFPPSMSIAKAKEYVFRELEQLPVRALGTSLRWHEDAERVVLRLGDGPAHAAVPVALEVGVRETVHARPGEVNGAGSPASSWHTCCMEFERCAGWHRARAEQWVRRHLGLCDLGRTARLDVPYRMRRDLAAVAAEFLFPGEYRLPPAEAAPDLGVPAVEFLPVPPPPDPLKGAAVAPGPRGGRRSRGAAAAPVATLPRRGGAGLELDLADPRHRDRLPSELRPDLPARGLVNYLEAQAAVRALEAILAEPAVRAAAGAAGGVAVVALYPAQAELIRRLMQQSPALAAADMDVRVDVPEAFRERECLVAVVSLTRSHSHRAVSYGAGPDALVTALTRARSRLVLLGDAGTLVRRGQWTNPLDHLDAAASAREHAIVARLVDYLQGRGAHPHAFQFREGSLQ
jgi:hypothetical protein